MAGEQDPKRQGAKAGEDTSGLIDLLELAATEKKTQTGKHPAVSASGRTPQGGTRGVGDTGRRSVIRVATPPTGETPVGTSSRNGAVVRTMTPPTGTPAVPAVVAAPAVPTPARSKLPLVVGGVVAAAAVVGAYLILGRPPAPVVSTAAVPAERGPAPRAPEPLVQAAKPAAAPEAARPAEGPAARPAEAEVVVKAETAKPSRDKKMAKAEPANAEPAKPEPARTETREKGPAAATEDPLAGKAKDRPAPKAEEPPRTEAARLAGEAVTKEKKDKKGKGGDALSDVLSGSSEEKDKPAAAKAEDALPEKLSQGDLKKGMAPVAKKAADCYEKYQVPGLAQVKLTIEPSGKVAGAKVLGSYDGTPTGQCLLDAVSRASFPRSRSPLSLTYPFMLR